METDAGEKAMNENRLALKPYLESIQEHCGHLTKEELLEIILGLSREIPVKRRGELLEKIAGGAGVRADRPAADGLGVGIGNVLRKIADHLSASLLSTRQ